MNAAVICRSICSRSASRLRSFLGLRRRKRGRRKRQGPKIAEWKTPHECRRIGQIWTESRQIAGGCDHTSKPAEPKRRGLSQYALDFHQHANRGMSPRIKADTFGWSTPSRRAAWVCVSLADLIEEQISLANSAFVSRSPTHRQHLSLPPLARGRRARLGSQLRSWQASRPWVSAVSLAWGVFLLCLPGVGFPPSPPDLQSQSGDAR